jgi:hypothetical protein
MFLLPVEVVLAFRVALLAVGVALIFQAVNFDFAPNSVAPSAAQSEESDTHPKPKHG